VLLRGLGVGAGFYKVISFAKWKSIKRLISDGYKYSLYLFLLPPLTCIVKWPEFAIMIS